MRSSVIVAVMAALFGVSAASLAAQEQPVVPARRDMGFVVTDFGYARSDRPTSCPNGRSIGYRAIFALSAEGQRRPGESDTAYTQRLDSSIEKISSFNGESICMHPERGVRDPYFRIMSSTTTRTYGINLDGQDDHANARPAPGTCAHDDFLGPNDERGIDNQLFRVMGCSVPAEYTSGPISGLTIEMLTRSWGILFSVSGVADTHEDQDVVVHFYANADPIRLGPNREPLANASYTPDHDPRFRAKARGRIINGVLTTDPVDVRFHSVLNGMMLERPLQDARLRVSFTPDGGFEGYLAGYTPIADAYDMEYGFRNGMRGGVLAPLPLRTLTAAGKASVIGYTCEGAYQALQQLADGHRDPRTGRCASISTQYHIRAIPAFVVDNVPAGAGSDQNP